jgi:hypothetical protein
MIDLPMINHCGECTACCTVVAVGEIGKAQNQPCQHICEQGCRIYEARPSSCQKYACLWLYSQSKDKPLPPEWRPDRLGVVIEGAVTNLGPVVVVRELLFGAAETEKARDAYTYLGSLTKGSVMIVHPDNTRTIKLPRQSTIMDEVGGLFAEKPSLDPNGLKQRKKLLKRKLGGHAKKK